MIDEEPDAGVALLYFFAAVGGIAFGGGALLLLALWLFADRAPVLLLVAMSMAAVVAVGGFVLARRASPANRQWHPGTFTFEDWPLVAGIPTSVTYELRRRNPVAEHPDMSVQLLLREGGTDAFRTVERMAVDVERERRIEPITLEFALEIPEAWIQTGTRRRVALEVARTADDFRLAHSIDLVVAGA